MQGISHELHTVGIQGLGSNNCLLTKIELVDFYNHSGE